MPVTVQDVPLGEMAARLAVPRSATASHPAGVTHRPRHAPDGIDPEVQVMPFGDTIAELGPTARKLTPLELTRRQSPEGQVARVQVLPSAEYAARLIPPPYATATSIRAPRNGRRLG